MQGLQIESTARRCIDLIINLIIITTTDDFLARWSHDYGMLVLSRVASLHITERRIGLDDSLTMIE
jgi:hypothetical protein